MEDARGFVGYDAVGVARYRKAEDELRITTHAQIRNHNILLSSHDFIKAVCEIRERCSHAATSDFTLGPTLNVDTPSLVTVRCNTVYTGKQRHIDMIIRGPVDRDEPPEQGV